MKLTTEEVNKIVIELANSRQTIKRYQEMEQRAREVAAGQTYLAEVDMRTVAKHILGELNESD